MQGYCIKLLICALIQGNETAIWRKKESSMISLCGWITSGLLGVRIYAEYMKRVYERDCMGNRPVVRPRKS